ncbi:hypothetical protein DXG03_007241 [Asterophora parasitica]|uniref:Probable alpha/beta-glucosidase agdC n=1 Tax=Asterophora parasitica TaxID=117018 RepID=A0A9P7FY95_9AGAR|nr:hypothetical protein DXG03_007241 [Asterophora parasitica]
MPTLWSSLRVAVLASLLHATGLHAAFVDPKVLDACSGYSASNIQSSGAVLTADLVLNGQGCNVFGSDIKKLGLKVTYETSTRINVKIVDAAASRFEVPQDVFPRPPVSTPPVVPSSAEIQFNYTASPFSFSVYRTASREVLFSTASYPLIFEPQYLRVKTSLPANANIYGLGEHTHPFHLPTQNTTLTLWSRDSYGIPVGTNLYGNHPVYFEHRTTGTHGVFLLNANGMDIKLTNAGGAPALEYNVIGGVLDFYFLAGSTTDPTAVARQYAQVAGLPAEVPYWSFGFHQCRFGYKDYMDRRRVFTLDPQYFPVNRMREIVNYLHARDQKYIVMTDPAVGYAPNAGYGAYDRGTALDIWLKAANGSASLGVVWPGVTVYPDWFHPKVAQYWNKEFELFYSPTNGLDIDGVWIDMNEPASFCDYPCANPFQQAIDQRLPPPRTSPPPNPNAPIFVKSNTIVKRDDLLNPPYAINNAAGPISAKTAFTNSKHFNGLTEYDAHNLYGAMMSTATSKAMLARRPGKRTFVITRSTFAGAGRDTGKWLGDNLSTWEHYRISIAGMLGFASVYQVPMVGSDICGFGADATERLCARWATLGAFYPFMRNHNQDSSPSQEFYRWASVTQAAKNVIDIRYRLLDYIYTAFHQAHLDGTPVLHPLWFKYPKDKTTFPIDLQFFYGDSILVSPVTQDDSTSVTFYLPNDIFYDFKTLAPVKGLGAPVTLNNVPFTDIPLHIKGGAVLPLRAQSALTTTALRKRDFEFIVAPGTDGTASGALYIDDGESIVPSTTTSLKLTFKNGLLSVQGVFGYQTSVNTSRVRFLGVAKAPGTVQVSGKAVAKAAYSYDAAKQVLDVTIGLPLNAPFNVQYT